MHVVIDIPEEEYAFCKKQYDTECLDTLMIAVKYGTPLPNHGIDKAIKELEQEPALDKVRAEIEQIIGERNLDDYDFCSGLICARNIIDKYKAEIINSTTKSDLAGDYLDIQNEYKEEIEDLER